MCCCTSSNSRLFSFIYLAGIKTGFTLGKHERIKSRKLLEQLFREGSYFHVHPFKVYYQFAPLPGDAKMQAAFGASARTFKQAVDRNRIKRLMREAYRLQKNGLQSLLEGSDRQLGVFFLFVGKEVPGYAEVKDKMGGVLTRLEEMTVQHIRK